MLMRMETTSELRRRGTVIAMKDVHKAKMQMVILERCFRKLWWPELNQGAANISYLDLMKTGPERVMAPYHGL